MRILVTGAAGFIGSSLCDHLKKQGHFVIGMDNLSYGSYNNLYNENKEFAVNHFYNEDIRNNFYFPDNIDIVFHLAAIAPLPDCQSNPIEAYDVNVTGTVNVLEKSRSAGVKKVIFASSNAVCENEYNSHGFSTLDSEPDLIYPMTKRASENICRSYVRNYGMDIKVVRIANVYGPSQDYFRKHPPLMGYIINCLKDKIPPKFRNVNAKRDYIYIKDLCSFFVAMMLNDRSHASLFFTGTAKKKYSVQNIFSTFKEVWESDINYEKVDSSGFWDKYPELFTGTYSLDKKRITREVMKESNSIQTFYPSNWEPQYSLIEGVTEIVNFVKEKYNEKTKADNWKDPITNKKVFHGAHFILGGNSGTGGF